MSCSTSKILQFNTSDSTSNIIDIIINDMKVKSCYQRDNEVSMYVYFEESLIKSSPYTEDEMLNIKEKMDKLYKNVSRKHGTFPKSYNNFISIVDDLKKYIKAYNTLIFVFTYEDSLRIMCKKTENFDDNISLLVDNFTLYQIDTSIKCSTMTYSPVYNVFKS